MNSLTEALVSAGIAIVVALIGIITRSITQYASSKNLLTNLENKEKIALSAVKYTEQFLTEIGGREKYQAAKEKFIKIAEESGLKISDEDIRIFLESAVNTMNNEYQANKPMELKESITTITPEEYAELFISPESIKFEVPEKKEETSK